MPRLRHLVSHTRGKCSPSCSRWVTRSHHLVTAAAEIPDRGAPDVDQSRERKDQKNGHAEEEMQLENRMCVCNQRRNARLQREYALRPGHEPHHFMAVEMIE